VVVDIDAGSSEDLGGLGMESFQKKCAHGRYVLALRLGFQFGVRSCHPCGVKSLARILGALLLVGVVTTALLLASGYSLAELQHIGQPRNVLDDRGRDVPLPLPVGEPVRLLDEVPVTTAGEHGFITVDGEVPVRVDPCRPATWVLSPEGMPPLAREQLDAAIADISARTGIQFEFMGETDERAEFDRPIFQDRYGEGYAPIIVGWSDGSTTSDLEGHVSGVGGSTAIPGAYGDQRFLRSGVVILDGPEMEPLLASTAGAQQVKAIMMHELGHVLGLAHVADASELMHETNDDQVTWGAGDLQGLAIAGAGPCE